MNETKRLRVEARELFKLATPLFIAQLAQMGTGVVDTIMAGRYSSIDLAAISIGYNIWLPIYLVSLGIMIAVTSIVAQHYGAGRVEAIRRLLPQAFWVALVIGFVCAPLCYFPGPILDLLSLDSETFSRSEGYLKAVAFGLPGAALFQALRCHVQGVGIIRPFAIASVIGFFANIPLNYAFIYGHWGIPEMGAPGCGWATAISMWLGPLLIVFYATRSKALKEYMPSFTWHPPQRAPIMEILSVGAPIGATFFFEMAVFSVIGLMIASVGNTHVSAHQIAINVYDVLYMPLVAIGAAMATRVGHSIGREDMVGVKASIHCAMLISVLFCIAIAAILWQTPGLVSEVYTDDKPIQTLAIILLRLNILFVVFDTFAVVASFGLRAFKDTRFPFLVMTIAYWMFALPLGYQLGMTDSQSSLHGAVGFWWAMIGGVGVAALLNGWRLKRWLSRPLPPQDDHSEDNPTPFAA